MNNIYSLGLLIFLFSGCKSDLPFFSVVESNVVSEGNYRINKIDFHSNQFGIALTDSSRILKTTNGGLGWEEVEIGNGLNLINFTDISFTDESTACIIGKTTFFPEPKVFQTHDEGLTWSEIVFPLFEVRDISYPTLNDAYATDGRSIYKQASGGYWNTIFTLTSAETIDKLLFFDAALGIYTTVDGGLYYTTNGGLSWEQKINESDAITDIHFEGNVGVVVQNYGRYWVTLDRGETWEIVAFNNAGLKVCVVDQNHVYGSGAIGVTYTENIFSQTWDSFYHQDGTPFYLSDIYFTETDRGYGIYEGKIYQIVNLEAN